MEIYSFKESEGGVVEGGFIPESYIGGGAYFFNDP